MLKGFRYAYAAASPLTVAGNLFPKVALMPAEETVISVKTILLRKIPGQETFRNYKQITPTFALIN